MTAKEIKDYLRIQEKTLWEEMNQIERELKARKLNDEKWSHYKYIRAASRWAIIWEIINELGITEE